MSLPIPGWPEKKSCNGFSPDDAPIEMDNFEASAYAQGVDFGRIQTLSLCEDALRKACEEGKLEEVINNAVAKLLGIEPPKKVNMMAGKGIAQAIRAYLLGEGKNG